MLDTQGYASQNLRAGRAGTVFGRHDGEIPRLRLGMTHEKKICKPKAKRASPSESANFPLGNLTRVLGGISLCVFVLFLEMTAFGQNQLSYTAGETIDLREMGYSGAHVRARMEWLINEVSDGEITYRSRRKKISMRDVELRDQKLRFHRAGDYLVEFIRPDQTKDIGRVQIQTVSTIDFSALFKDVHLYAFRDSFYKTIYHLELRFVPAEKAPPLKGDEGSMFQVLWRIDGGRYHLLDDGLPYFSRTRIFQKSIVLKEFKTYDIIAYLKLADGQTIEKRVTIDLLPELERSPLLLPESPGFQFSIHQPIHLSVSEEAPLETFDQYAWVVKAVRQNDCPQEWLELENADDPATRGVLHYICDNGHEEELAQNRDFALPTQKMREAEILFKKPGEYEVDLVVFDGSGRAYAKSSKRFILYKEKN